jgi:hypothetical protein
MTQPGPLATFRNAPSITPASFNPATGVYTPTQQDNSDVQFNSAWNRHPDRAFYGILTQSGSQAIPATTPTRIQFTTCEQVTFNAGPPVLDRIYIIDNGVYEFYIGLGFAAATTATLEIISDTNLSLINSPQIVSGAQNLLYWSGMYRFYPYVGTDGQFSLGVAINATAAATLTSAQYQLACIGRLGYPPINNP